MNCFQYYLLDDPSLSSSFYYEYFYIENVACFFPRGSDDFFVDWGDGNFFKMSCELDE